MFDWLRRLFKRRPDPWERQWRDTEPLPARGQPGRWVPPRPIPPISSARTNPDPTYAKPPAPPKPPPAVTYIERRRTEADDVPIDRDTDFLLGVATATLLSSVRTEEEAKPSTEMRSGEGGDFAGGGASGSWETDSSSTPSTDD